MVEMYYFSDFSKNKIKIETIPTSTSKQMMNDNTKATIQTKLANELNVWIRMNSTNTITDQNHIENS